MRTHFTAWLTNAPDCLEGDNCDVTVLPDEANTYYDEEEEIVSWESTGTDVFQAVTSIDARNGDIEQAVREAEELLEAAGWRITGNWDATPTSYVVEVERRDCDETWTLQQAADHMGSASTNTADQALRRLDVKPVGRAPGRGGQNLFNAAEVMYAHATRPGRGARTDLRGSAE